MQLSEEERRVIIKSLDALLQRPKPQPNQMHLWHERSLAQDLQTRVRLEA